MGGVAFAAPMRAADAQLSDRALSKLERIQDGAGDVTSEHHEDSASAPTSEARLEGFARICAFAFAFIRMIAILLYPDTDIVQQPLYLFDGAPKSVG